jgi:pimeloyl-ACP methyl ester carboxylesterase
MSGWKQSLRRILITLAVIYGLLCAGVFIFQRRLIYFPTRIPPNVIQSVAKEHGFEPWKNPAGQIIGWKTPTNRPAAGSVLIVHGNAGCALGRDYIAQPIHAAAALDVFVLEYPGYGARGGSPSETTMVAAAEEAFQMLSTNAPRYVVSESIGTGVACALARNHPADVSGMALFVPYSNLASVAQKHFPFLPAYFLLRDRFNPGDCLRSYRGPVQFVVAGSDEILGPDTGEKLCAGYGGPKRLEVIPGARHNDVSGQTASWWRKVFIFWRQSHGDKTGAPGAD